MTSAAVTSRQERLLNALGIDQGTAATLRDALPIVEPHIPSRINQFYDLATREFPASIAKYLDRFGSADQVKQILIRSDRAVMSGKIDDEYFSQAATTGRLLADMSIEPAMTMMIMAHRLQTYSNVLMRETRWSRKKRMARLAALQKVLVLQINEIYGPYITRLREKIVAERVEVGDKLEVTVADMVTALTNASQKIEGAARDLATIGEETSKQASAIAVAFRQASGNVEMVAAAAEELTASIREIARQAEYSTTVTRKGAEEAKATDAAVQGLTEATRRIGEVAQLINSIAGQTNLLALNAIIEAARAGEAGKGFAVVAHEVKNLAGQTAHATGDITAQIGAIETATDETVKVVREIGGTIGEIDEIAATIASAVVEQGAATAEIQRNVQEAAAGTRDVATSIPHVARAADDTKSASTEVLSAAQEMSADVLHLNELIKQFLRRCARAVRTQANPRRRDLASVGPARLFVNARERRVGYQRRARDPRAALESPMASTSSDHERLLNTLGIDESTLATLRDALPIIEPHVPARAKQFYDLASRELPSAIEKYRRQLGSEDDVRQIFMRNDRAVMSGTIDDQYFAQAASTGRHLADMSIEPIMIIMMMAHRLNTFSTTLMRETRWNPRKRMARLAALQKILVLQVNEIYTSYISRLREKIAAERVDVGGKLQASMSDIVATLADASQRIEGAARHLAQIGDETSRQASSIAASSEQASTNVETVAAATEELSTSIREISRQTEHSATITRRGADEARATDTAVQGLADAAQRIGEGVQLINSIAGQTNLWALNATIEAARAGEAGKGFAVVASEVKNLANQTAQATEDITAQIGSIQTATNETVKAIRGIGGTIGEIDEIAATIAAAVDEQGAAAGKIMRNVQVAAAGARDVSTSIPHVARGADDTKSASTQVLSAAQAMSAEVVRLGQIVEQFLASLHEDRANAGAP